MLVSNTTVKGRIDINLVFRPYLMPHEPPDIQNYPSSDFNLRGMRSAPSVLLSVHVAARRWTLNTCKAGTKVNFKGQRPLKEKSPRKHLHFITDQNIRVPFVDDAEQSWEEVFFFSHIQDIVIRDSCSTQQRSWMANTGVLRCVRHCYVASWCRSYGVFIRRLSCGIFAVRKTVFFLLYKENNEQIINSYEN